MYVGDISSMVAIVFCFTVASAPSPPVFVEAPASVFVALLDRASLSCVATGFPQPTIQWYKDDSPLPDEMNTVLAFEEITLSNRGRYYCTASNSQGSIKSASVVLGVTGVRQYLFPVLTTLSGSVNSTDAFSGVVMQLDTLGAGQVLTQLTFLYKIQLFGPLTVVPSNRARRR